MRVLVSSLCIGMATAGCSIQHRPKLQYAGTLTSTAASCPTTRGTLVVQRDQVVFAPDNSTWTLVGKLAGSTVEASRSRPSFDHKLFATDLKASLTEDQVTGTYTTPNCTYAVALARF